MAVRAGQGKLYANGAELRMARMDKSEVFIN